MMTERGARGREREKEREGDKNKSLLALNLFFVEFFTSEWGRHHRSADGGVSGGRGGCGAHMYTVLNHTS